MQLPGLTIGIIADDLTGACDTALQFFHSGCQTHILLDLKEPESVDDAVTVWSMNTNSRHLDARDATSVVKKSG